MYLEERADPYDFSTCKRLADEASQRVNFSSASRNVLLHLLFPDEFERISSTEHKRRIVAAFKEHTADATDVDDALRNVRRALEVLQPEEDIEFYDNPDLRNQWNPKAPSSAPAIRWWVEKTETHGWDYRLEGELAVGRALIAPKSATDGRDVFRAMRDVEPGDVVLHLTDRAGFTDFSRVSDAYAEVETPSEFEGGVPRAYVVRLTDHRSIDPPLMIEALFSSPYREQLVRLRNDSKAHLFYSGTDKLELRSGANYITPVPPELVALLRDAYHELTGGDLVPTDWFNPGGAGPKGDTRPSSPPPTLDDLTAATHLDRTDLEELEALLLDKRQLMLEGPPGSGKTYVADLFARYFVGAPLAGGPDERVETVQFHQSYGYEDFVQGIRPVTDEQGQLQYRVVPGIFARLCDLAGRTPDERFVLIVDEINRGNLSRIFGELLLLLEYRDKRVRLPFGGGVGVGGADGASGEDWLSIPPNLYLIGTMNSTDRSLALIDYALRRRFYFYRLLPVVAGRAPVLDRWLAGQGMPVEERRRLIDRFVALNRRIEERLSPDFQVGHSYFMRDDIGTDAGLDRVWRRAVRPLLEEYFHGARDREAALAEFEPDRLSGLPAPDTTPDADDVA